MGGRRNHRHRVAVFLIGNEKMRIGLDFDNTLVSYDDAFATVGREVGLLPDGFSGGKEAVRDALLRCRPDGFLWERLQGLVYGRQIHRASLFPGAAEFLARCRDKGGIELYVVSHKTELAHHDPLETNLRQAALTWMERQGFFLSSGAVLDPDHVIFEGTRDHKVQRIAKLGCDLFVDDLIEVLEHHAMPEGCRKIKFRGPPQSRFEQYQSWQEISDAVFADR